MDRPTQSVEASASITEKEIDRLRARIGSEIQAPPPFVSRATPDSIRNWTLGIGDANPLWTDENYAARGPHGGLVAPPSMLYAFDRRASGGGGGLPGVHAMFAGTSWSWTVPVRLGDELSVRAVLHDVIVHRSRFAGTSVQQVSEVTFSRSDGTPVGVCHPYSFRVGRSAAREKAKYKSRPLTPYTSSELAEIWDQVVSEKVRGSEPRYWDDIKLGESIDTIVRGPLTISDIIVFIRGWGGLYLRSHADWIRWYRRHPAGGVVNEFGVPESPERVHWDEDFAKVVGVPGAYDYGPQRISWIINSVTNWIGDNSWLSLCEVRLLRHVLVGDVVWCSGVVSSKHLNDQRQGTVQLSLFAHNQRHELVAEGSAEVLVPQRSQA